MTTLDNPGNTIDPKQVSMRPTAMRYGLIGGLILIAFGLVVNVSGLNQPGSSMSWVTGLISVAIFAAVLVIAVKYHRDQELGGYITFGRSFGLSMLTVLIMAVLGAIFTYVYMAFIDPSMADQMLEMTREQYESMGMSEEQIEQSLSMAKTFMQPHWAALMGILGNLFFGAIVGLIISAVMKKNPPEFA